MLLDIVWRLALTLLLSLVSRIGAQDIDLGAALGGLGAALEKSLAGVGGAGGAGGPGAGKQREICPNGQFIVPRPLKHLKKGVLVANGCGPQGMAIKEAFGLWRCCNRHDVCFSSCATSFDFCEKKFEACMQKRCMQKENKVRQSECKKQAKSFSDMTKTFGRSSHSKTMLEVCDCVATEGRAQQNRREWVIDVYRRFGPREKAENTTFIDQTLQKHAGKEGQLYYDLITKYGAADGFVAFDGVANTFEYNGPSEVTALSSAANSEL